MANHRSVEAAPSFEASLACVPRTAATVEMLSAAVEDLARRADVFPPIDGSCLRTMALVGPDDATPALSVFFRIEEKDDRVVLIHVEVTQPGVGPSYEAAVPLHADAGDSQHEAEA